MTLQELKTKKIAVLMGGDSAERQISLRTGAAVLKALHSRGYDAYAIDTAQDPAGQLLETGAEVAFIALHGRHGEDGTMQGLLEILRIPYTGSGVLASSLAMDKVATKKILLYHGQPTPEFSVFRRGQDVSGVSSASPFEPLIVKPAREGSTIGIVKVSSPAELPEAVETALKHDDCLLIERFIQGREVTVGVLDGEALPVLEIVPKSGMYDYHAKYTAGQTDYLLPAPLDEALSHQIQRSAEAVCNAIGCQGAARVDYMVCEQEFYCLEVNTIPGMTETSLLPKAAGFVGIDFEELVERILCSAGLGK